MTAGELHAYRPATGPAGDAADLSGRLQSWSADLALARVMRCGPKSLAGAETADS